MAWQLHDRMKAMSDERSGRRVPPDPDERRADRFAIGHDAFQFRFDFWQSGRGEKERAITRIVTSPAVASGFSEALRESLRQYEHGTCPVVTGGRTGQVLHEMLEEHVQAFSERDLKDLHGRAASQSCRLLDFEEADVRPGIVNDTWILVVRGNAPCANMRVELLPLIYIKQPEFWEIEVVGCTSGPICLPQAKPFTEILPLNGTIGTAGIEVVGTSRRMKIALP
jgi:hypothetical protein